MNKKELFEKYRIDETHNVWDNGIDNWMGVEIFRVMHDGRLPEETDTSLLYVLDFLEKRKSNIKWWVEEIMMRSDWGSLYLTAKRTIYMHADALVEQYNQKK